MSRDFSCSGEYNCESRDRSGRDVAWPLEPIPEPLEVLRFSGRGGLPWRFRDRFLAAPCLLSPRPDGRRQLLAPVEVRMNLRGAGRKRPMKTIVCALVALMVLPCWARAAGVRARPNVVVFLTDDLGYGDLACHGNAHVKTPCVDGFARQSVEFTQFHVSPVCAPTRASLMTGRYNFRTGVADVFGQGCHMDPSEVTVAEMLRAAGYATGIFGKWHLGDDNPAVRTPRASTRRFRSVARPCAAVLRSDAAAQRPAREVPGLLHGHLHRRGHPLHQGEPRATVLRLPAGESDPHAADVSPDLAAAVRRARPRRPAPPRSTA